MHNHMFISENTVYVCKKDMDDSVMLAEYGGGHGHQILRSELAPAHGRTADLSPTASVLLLRAPRLAQSRGALGGALPAILPRRPTE